MNSEIYLFQHVHIFLKITLFTLINKIKTTSITNWLHLIKKKLLIFIATLTIKIQSNVCP